jgi:hypothetical protein
MILVFVKHLNESVKGLKISSQYEVSPVSSIYFLYNHKAYHAFFFL